jgi:uncharacterized protein YaiE (UPF0345 family)
MIKHNQYFEGNVQSLALEGHDKPVTVGVMAAGEYEFGTDAAELMKVIHGELIVKLPGSADWASFKSGSEFSVEGNSKFQLQVPVDTAYLCIYG